MSSSSFKWVYSKPRSAQLGKQQQFISDAPLIIKPLAQRNHRIQYGKSLNKESSATLFALPCLALDRNKGSGNNLDSFNSLMVTQHKSWNNEHNANLLIIPNAIIVSFCYSPRLKPFTFTTGLTLTDTD